jgi:tetratricopeptide (TPR) repeat protein
MMRRSSALASAAAVFLALSGAPALAQGAAARPAAPPPALSAEASAAIARFLEPYAAASAACRAVLKEAATLSFEGKWKSAFQAVDDFDKDNADPFALAMKTSLVLRGAVRTDMDRAFGLADLEQGQDLESFRNSQGDYSPIAFDPPALADAQAAKGVAAPGILSKELGDYYFDVAGRFSGKWAISDDEILAKIAEQYAKAYGAGVFDGASLVNHAETLVRLNRGDDSDPIFKAAIALEPKDASVEYRYALSLEYRGKKAEALVEVDKAIAEYGEDQSRIDAIALGARNAAELGDDAKAQTYYALADKYYPDSPTPGILRQMTAVQTGNDAAAAAAADGLVPLYGSNPNVVRTLVSSWYAAGDPAAARAFLDRNIAKSADDLTIGTLDFYLAVLLSQGDPSDADKAAALRALDEAETHFKAKLGPDNQVFGVIAEIRGSLQPAPGPGETGDSAGGAGAADGPDSKAK